MSSLLKTLIAQCLLLGALCLFTNISHAQYFSKEYDYDTSYDFGKNITLLANGGYRIFDGIIAASDGTWSLTSFDLSPDGSQISGKKGYGVKDMNSSNGYYGRMATTNTGQLLMPFTIFGKYHYSYQCAILKMGTTADSIFIKAYTDTLKNAENSADIAFDPVNNHYVLAVESLDTNGSLASKNGVLIITDTDGNLIIRKVFEKKSVIKPVFSSGVGSSLHSVEVLPNGDLLLGGYNRSVDYKGSGGTQRTYLHDRPWFIITDSQGNILKDSAYGDAFVSTGDIHTDRLGGYYHWGMLDTIITNNAGGFQNFPSYVAAIDANFKIRWLHSFASLKHHVQLYKILQLRNGDYLALGEILTNPPEVHGGWACRLTRNGSVRWEQAYSLDTTSDIGVLVDAAERRDGSLAMVGMWPKNKNLPSYRLQDVWLLSVDSNGCELPGCKPTAVPNVPKLADESYKVFPNPATESISIDYSKEATAPETFSLHDITGRLVASAKLIGRDGTSILNIGNLPVGLYIYRITAGDGKVRVAGKISKQ